MTFSRVQCVALLTACLSLTVVACLPPQQSEDLCSTELGVPPLDPIEIPFLETRHVDGNITLFLHLKNIKIYGFRGVKIINVKVSLEEYKLEVTSKMDSLSIQGDYISEGRILQFPLASDGHFLANFTDVTAAWIVYLQSVKRNKTDYLQIDGFSLDMMPTNVNFKAGNLLDGDNTLGEALNMVLNDNSSEVYNHIKARLMSLFSSYFTEIVDTVLRNYPEKQLFPD